MSPLELVCWALAFTATCVLVAFGLIVIGGVIQALNGDDQ